MPQCGISSVRPSPRASTRTRSSRKRRPHGHVMDDLRPGGLDGRLVFSTTDNGAWQNVYCRRRYTRAGNKRARSRGQNGKSVPAMAWGPGAVGPGDHRSRYGGRPQPHGHLAALVGAGRRSCPRNAVGKIASDHLRQLRHGATAARQGRVGEQIILFHKDGVAGRRSAGTSTSSSSTCAAMTVRPLAAWRWMPTVEGAGKSPWQHRPISSLSGCRRSATTSSWTTRRTPRRSGDGEHRLEKLMATYVKTSARKLQSDGSHPIHPHQLREVAGVAVGRSWPRRASSSASLAIAPEGAYVGSRCRRRRPQCSREQQLQLMPGGVDRQSYELFTVGGHVELAWSGRPCPSHTPISRSRFVWVLRA